MGRRPKEWENNTIEIRNTSEGNKDVAESSYGAQYLSNATVKRASKRKICFATLLQNGLKNYVTRFTAHV